MPLPGASPVAAVARFFRKYAVFSGRASRSEYWWVELFLFVVYGLASIPILIGFVQTLAVAAQAQALLAVEKSGQQPSSQMLATAETLQSRLGSAQGTLIVGSIIVIVVVLALIVPSLALVWRRFHDQNRSGLFWLLSFIPTVGGIIVLIFMLMPSDPAGARFDKAGATPAAPVVG